MTLYDEFYFVLRVLLLIYLICIFAILILQFLIINNNVFISPFQYRNYKLQMLFTTKYITQVIHKLSKYGWLSRY